MEKMSIEDSVYDIFLKCVDNPELIDALKTKLSLGKNDVISENNPEVTINTQSAGYENQLAIYSRQHKEVMSKLEEIISKQTELCLHFSSETNNSQMKSIRQYEEKIDAINKRHTEEINVLKEETSRAIEKQKKEYNDRIDVLKNKSEEDRKKAQEKIEEMKQKNAILVDQIELLKAERKKMEIERDGLFRRYEMEKMEYSAFDESLVVWKCLCSLKQENKEYIANLCGGFDILSTLSLGRDDGKIDQLWACIRDQIVKGDIESSDINNICKYFEFCIKVSNSIKKDSERYVFFGVDEGSDYEIDLCIKTADSKQIGNISKMVMKGVRVGNTVKYKAIVKVE